MGDAVAKAELFDSLARVGKALGSGTRLELLDLLAQRERSVEALARAAGVGITTCSAHLQTLRQAGLVATRRDGTKIHYRLAGADVAALYALLRDVAGTHSAQAAAARDSYLGADDTEAVDRDELQRRLATGQVIAVDVRPAEEYTAGHIPGALSIPLEQLTDRLSELPDDVEVVAYCRGAYCVLAHDAVRLLAARGRRAARLVDGMLEWRLANLPVDAAT
ncbi:ArsR/SmtB family transcription factor [Micromonospora sp. NBC_00858]|uniref:ArsR/SmtB family transcription factor n=1 Tax=Micromonospora sp. NBC_00858 TaxID=2975979 RepID=UPI003865CA87|nr:metalloregulator ArsR/SmtB family transcription factor [Micromonospora sp. NBC_00858]